MPALTPVDATTAQWNAIVSTMRTEAASGRLKNCNWTDVTGTPRTSTLADVRRSLHLYTQQPKGTASAGVMLSHSDLNRYASTRRFMVTEFMIRISVEAIPYGGGTPANGDDALAQCFAFISDGTGNGLSEIFRDPANYTLGGNAQACLISKVAPFLQIGDGATPEIIADVLVTLRCEKLVGIS